MTKATERLLETESGEMITVEQFRSIRKEAGLRINPENAEVDWAYAQILDPYGIRDDLPEEADCVGRTYFARSPGSDVWVAFEDLPEATARALAHRCEPSFTMTATGLVWNI